MKILRPPVHVEHLFFPERRCVSFGDGSFGWTKHHKNSTTWALQIDMFDHQLRDTVPLSSTPHMLFPPAFPLPPILQPSDPSLPRVSGARKGCSQRVGTHHQLSGPNNQKMTWKNVSTIQLQQRTKKKQNKTNNLATHITTVVSWTNFFGAFFWGDDPPGMDSESWWCFEPWWERWFFVEGYHLTPKNWKTWHNWYCLVPVCSWKIPGKFYNLHGLSLGVVLGVVLLFFFYKTKMCRRGGGWKWILMGYLGKT